MFINTNLSAIQSSRFLAESNSLLTKALSRLSSGNKIVSPEDDAGGLAQSSKLNSQVRRIDALVQNTGNLVSFLQTQEGYLQKVSKALDRMSELSIMAKDATKNSADVSLYTQEFDALEDFIDNVMNKKFNGINLFSDNPLTVLTDSDGTSKTFAETNLASTVGRGNGEYTIELNFTGGLTDDQKNLFYSAANRWQSIITQDLIDSGGVDDLSITVNATAIDGVGGVLGNASPTTVRGGSPAVTITGTMNFDTADLDSLESDGRLYAVILHEIGHVLGIGSLWSAQGLLTTGDGPEYIGTSAVA
ncbi:MAG: flagellin, partial [Verrucomicrobia bacterium]|nr:flagellin [Verrucomicrobiota bacterium]